MGVSHGVFECGAGCVTAHGEVDYVCAVVGGVDDAGGDVGVCAGAPGVEYFYGHDAAFPGDAGDAGAVAGGGGVDAGAVGAVAVVVFRVAVVVDEVVTGDEFGRQVGMV